MRYLILALTLAQPLAALPVLNGSFESPNLTFTQNLTGPITLPGWTGHAPSQGGNAGLVVGPNNGLTPADGAQHFTFNGGNPSDAGYLEQTIATTPGATYDLTFALGRAGGGQALSLLVFNQTYLPPPTPGYSYHTLTFTASGPTTLRFTDTSGPNSISDLYLDDIRLTQAAPAPDTGPSLPLLIGAAAMLIIARRKRA